MIDPRLPDYVGHILQASADACDFVRDMSKEQFLRDKRTQQAVVMSLIVIGEAATKLMDGSPDFFAQHADVPWRSMRGMRNRIAHGYFDINLEVVWKTVHFREDLCLCRLKPTLHSPAVPPAPQSAPLQSTRPSAR